MKKTDGARRQIVSADISSESLSGMVIFRPHYVRSVGAGAGGTRKKGAWYALRPGEVRGFARALINAADLLDQQAKSQQAAKVEAAAP